MPKIERKNCERTTWVNRYLYKYLNIWIHFVGFFLYFFFIRWFSFSCSKVRTTFLPFSIQKSPLFVAIIRFKSFTVRRVKTYKTRCSRIILNIYLIFIISLTVFDLSDALNGFAHTTKWKWEWRWRNFYFIKICLFCPANHNVFSAVHEFSQWSNKTVVRL